MAVTSRLVRVIAVSLVLATVALVAVAVALWLGAGTGGGLGEMARDWVLATATISLSLAGVGALIVVRRPANLVGWVFSVTAVTSALASAARYYATRALVPGSGLEGGEWAGWLFAWLIELNIFSFVVVALVFPHDRPRNRRRWMMVGGSMLAALLGAVTVALSPVDLATRGFPFQFTIQPVAVLPEAVAQVLNALYFEFLLPAGTLAPFVVAAVSFWRSRGIERQQWKMLTLALLGLVALGVVAGIDEDLTGLVAMVGIPALPIAIGLAILRYRLYDIDRIVSRTVTYALVTGALVALYGGMVVVLGGALEPLTGESDLAVAASTLAVAALFGPLRRRVQVAVDRRFNRRRYDAARAVESLGHRLRDEVGIDAVRTDLEGAVTRTVEPRTFSMWLREAPMATTAGERR